MLSPPFDPADAGTAEHEWQRSLRYRPAWRPRSGSLIVVAPHPDDEILGAGGLVRQWAMRGGAVTVLSVTDGEASHSGRANLGQIRRTELRSALRRLSNSGIKNVGVGIADGDVRRHENRLRAALRKFVAGAGTIVAPYEFDRHPDHEAVGRVCLEVARAQAVPVVRYPIWAWHHTAPARLHTLRWGIFRLAPATRRAKARALQCFESQLRPVSGPPIVPAHVLEHFARPYEAFLL